MAETVAAGRTPSQTGPICYNPAYIGSIYQGSPQVSEHPDAAMTASAPATAGKHPQWDTVAIVGVGLIGGSIGRDLLERGLARHVVGIGRREESLHIARQVGACSSTTLDLPRGLADAKLVIVCTPVGRVAQDVIAAASFAKLGALITDVGSTKGAIVGELDRELPHEAHFVGSHPLAGGEKAGPAAAVTGLFEGRTVVVTPGAMTPHGRCGADYPILAIPWRQGAHHVPLRA